MCLSDTNVQRSVNMSVSAMKPGTMSNVEKYNHTEHENPKGNSMPSSRSSSEEDYVSCANSVAVEADGKNEEVRDNPSIAAQTESSGVKMSANVANKLSEMRDESKDSLDENTENSYELNDETNRQTNQNSNPNNTTRMNGQRPSFRQVFPCISCLPFENNIVFCFVLSVWDNIVGPQTVNVWKRKSFPTQRTIDDLFEGEVEVGKDLTGLRGAAQTPLCTDATPRNTPTSADESWSDRHPAMGGRSRSRRYSSSTSIDSEIYSSSEQDSRSPARRVGRVGYTQKGSNARLSTRAEAFCEDFGNTILKESLGCVNEDPQRVQREDPAWHSSSKDGSTPSEPSDNQDQDDFPAKNHQKNEGEEQEFGNNWVYGRSRLRVGPVVWYVTVHSVGVGQVGPASQKVTSSLHVVPHQDIIIVAARFTVEDREGPIPYCLSMVVPLEEYHNFLPLTQMVIGSLVTIATTTRLLLTKHGLKGGKLIKDKLVDLCDVLVALRSASLDQYPLTPAAQPPDDRRFAELILTSHLQTMGSTLVVADSPNAANKVIMWLAQFSDPSTLPTSRLCLSYTQWPFHPGLFIQGIVRNSSGEVNLSAQKLIQSSRPLTVVDVNRGTVKQTGPPDVQARRNSSALRQELVSLWHDLSDVSVTSESLLESTRSPASLVKRFLHDYDRLSSCTSEVRQDFIRAFLRSLSYTALALITWTRHEWSAQRRKSGYGSLRRALTSVFDLEEADLRIVLAQTEILEPGFYSFVSSMSQ